MSENENFVNLRVSGKSDPKKVSGAMCRYIAEGNKVVLTAIGASAVSQAVKSLAIARGIMACGANELTFKVGFHDEMINDRKKTAMRFYPLISEG